MTPDPISTQPIEPTVIRSTEGMTTKVVKGSLWTLVGQVAPLGVSIFTTPFVIRMLGAEGYGVLILVGLIPTYFAFADLGMGIASTKFASEAYAVGDNEKEARTVRTAALISWIASIPIAAAIFIFSHALITAFNVPEHLQSEANLALKLASITFVVNFLNAIFNTPQLTRLRMELNTLVNSGCRIFGIIATPFVIFLGGGIAGILATLLIAALLNLAFHLYVSSKLLPTLVGLKIDRSLIRPMLRFGSLLGAAATAAMLVANLEKVVLPRFSDVSELAHYSVAFTLASMLTLFTSSMSTSLLPAFSQLQGNVKRDELRRLYERGTRLNLLWLFPVLVILSILAKPFFSIWAGQEYADASFLPFLIITGGLFFNILAYLPYSLIMASGRTDVFAKIYWGELIPYIFIVGFLVWKFGAIGAAAAWSIRMVGDAVLQFWMAKKITGLKFPLEPLLSFGTAALILIIPFALNLYYQGPNLVVIVAVTVCSTVYLVTIWKTVLKPEEITWLSDSIVNRFGWR